MTTPLTGIAKRVHDDIMALEPEAAVLYAQMVLTGALAHDVETHRDVLQKRIDEIVAKRVVRVKQAITKSFISKNISGEPVDALLAAGQAIAKAGFGNLSAEDRKRFARLQDRDQSGRFKSMHKQIRYDDYAKPHSGRYAKHLGIPEQKHLSRRDTAQYHQAYGQVADLLHEFTGLPAGMGQISLLYRTGPSGGLKRVTHAIGPDTTAADVLDADSFKGTKEKKLIEAQVIVDGGTDVNGAAFNLVGALANPYAGGRAVAGLEQDDEGRFKGATWLKSFADDWDRMLTTDVANPSNRIFRRISRTSQALSDTLGPNIPVQAKLALTTADAVGQYGPEAQKVIGPHADRAAYRYRGVERVPDAGLQRAVTSFTSRFGPVDGRNGLLRGRHEEVVTRSGVKPDFTESPIIGYFQGRLHSADLTHLQRKSGVIPPSEGVIIDKNGKVVTQAVGYGDDWYLPFNLKTLSKLKGGDYIRTRTWGGPTTEDIYTGLMSGAKSVTVVSHNGVYTIEFDDNFKGKRRFNDKAARMVKRYGHLLDAVQSEDVTLGNIPPARKAELREEAAREGDPSVRSERPAYEKRLGELMDDERHNPQLGPGATRALAEEFLNEKATAQSHDGTTRTWNEMAQGYVARNVAAEKSLFEQGMGSPDMVRQMQLLGLTPQTFDEDQAKRAAAARVSNPEQAIVALGFEKEWSDKLANAEGVYRESMSPLQLNGTGYEKAIKALKEQFPYYIASADWRPALRGGYDYGYVKPKFNRPEGVSAGYYDHNILGGGKVSADQTRYQNRGVTYVTRDELKARKTQAASDPDMPPAKTPAAGQSDVAALNALRRLHDHIAGQTTVTIAGKAVPIQGKTKEELAQLAPATFGMSLEDLMASSGSVSAAKEKVLADVDAIRANANINLPINQLLVDAVKSPERAVKGIPFTPAMALANPNQTFDFDDPKFGPDRKPDQYKRDADGILSHLNLDIDSSDAELDAYLRDQGEMLQTAQEGGAGRIRADKAGEYADRIKRVVQVKQLRRRGEEAQRKIDQAAALEEKERQAAIRDTPIVLADKTAEDFARKAIEEQNKTIQGRAEPREN